MCSRRKFKNLNLKVFNLMSELNETRLLGEGKRRFNESVFN